MIETRGAVCSSFQPSITSDLETIPDQRGENPPVFRFREIFTTITSRVIPFFSNINLRYREALSYLRSEELKDVLMRGLDRLIYFYNCEYGGQETAKAINYGMVIAMVVCLSLTFVIKWPRGEPSVKPTFTPAPTPTLPHDYSTRPVYIDVTAILTSTPTPTSTPTLENEFEQTGGVGPDCWDGEGYRDSNYCPKDWFVNTATDQIPDWMGGCVQPCGK